MRKRRGIRNQKGQSGLGGILSNLFGGFGSGGAAGGAGGTAGTSLTGYLQNLTNDQTGANQTAGSAANTYNAGQTGLQGSLGGLFNSFLGGQTPTSFTEPQAAITAANQQFNTNTEPGLVAQYGAGSPQIGAQQANMQQNLAANLYQTGQSNYLNALNSGAAYATTPTGQNTTGTGATQADTNQNVAGSQASGVGSIISVLAQLFGI